MNKFVKFIASAALAVTMFLPNTSTASDKIFELAQAPAAVEACNGDPSELQIMSEISGFVDAVVVVMKGVEAQAFRQQIAIEVGVPLSEVIDADTVVFAHPKNSELGVMILFKDGCQVGIGQAPVQEFNTTKEKSKGV